MVLSELEARLLVLVRRFVTRQRLVEQLIRDLRPYLLAGKRALGRPARSEILATAKGSWGPRGKWSFRMHGPGCKMTSQRTGEPLDWNAPDVQRFDAHCFFAWLDWYWNRPAASRKVIELRELTSGSVRGDRATVLAGLDALASTGALRRITADAFDYVLISPPATSGGRPSRRSSARRRRI